MAEGSLAALRIARTAKLAGAKVSACRRATLGAPRVLAQRADIGFERSAGGGVHRQGAMPAGIVVGAPHPHRGRQQSAGGRRPDPAGLVLLPEMDASASVPEITTACWSILHKDPGDMMCASSRMVVKRKGADRAVVLPCTLLPYDARFEMGGTLADAARAHGGMFDRGAVKLCHPHCAKFCVLGGGSCSVRS